MMREDFADIHQHVLWGLDDGPQTFDQMRALLEQDVSNGISFVFATTHAYPQMRPFDMPLYRERINQASAFCNSQGWPLRILPGCEIHYCNFVPDLLTLGKLPTLGDSRHVLIEFDPRVTLPQIGKAADNLYHAGYHPVIAHVERYRCLVRSPRRAMEMRQEYGLAYQMNCHTVLHPAGIWQRRFVRSMLAAQAIDAIATDAHDTHLRPVLMREAQQAVADAYGEAYAYILTHFGWDIACPERKPAL